MRRNGIEVAALLAAAVLVLPACGSEATALEAGLAPLAEVTDVAWPGPLGSPCPESAGLVLGTTFQVFGFPSYTEGHGRGCLNGTLKQVWAALQIPTGVQLSFYPERAKTDCEPRLNVETGYDVSFLTTEIPKPETLPAIVNPRSYSFEITWREGVTKGSAADPQEIRVKYGKTYGTTEVPWIKGSMVMFEDPPGTVRLEMVRQLNTKGWSDDTAELLRWEQGYYDAVKLALTTNPPGAALPVLCPLP